MRPGPCRHRARAFAAAATLMLAALPAAAAQAPSLEGTYTIVPEESDDIARAIERGTAKMNFVARPVARSRLKRTNPAYPTVVIARADDRFTITLGDRKPTVTPMSGRSVAWQNPEGETFRVSTVVQGSSVLQSFAAKDGRRENRFELSPDGRTLRMQVTITSGRLPGPVTYTLAFRRVS